MRRRYRPDPDRSRSCQRVALTAYVLLQYAVRARDQAFASPSRCFNVLPRSIAERSSAEPGVIAESHPAVVLRRRRRLHALR
jgi:hypothetical protein